MQAQNQEQQVNSRDVDKLRRMVGSDKHRPGADRWRLIAEQVPVWAIIGYIGALAGTTDPDAVNDEVLAQAAYDYDIPFEAVQAAMLYFREHRCAIDTLLEANAAALT